MVRFYIVFSDLTFFSGVLVVNITWRGKTYVGTLLDCARHTNQWSAPRYQIPVFRIRIGSRFNKVSGSGFGFWIRSRRAKMNHKNRQKLRNFMFWSAGCSLLRAEGFICSLDVLYGGLGIGKLQFLIWFLIDCGGTYVETLLDCADNSNQYLVCVKVSWPYFDPERYFFSWQL